MFCCAPVRMCRGQNVVHVEAIVGTAQTAHATDKDKMINSKPVG